jgi:hypothetical protein
VQLCKQNIETPFLKLAGTFTKVTDNTSNDKTQIFFNYHHETTLCYALALFIFYIIQNLISKERETFLLRSTISYNFRALHRITTLSRMLSFSGIWHRAVLAWTDVCEESITWVLSVRHQLSKKSACSRWLGSYFTMKMEVIRSFETSVHIRTTRRYILEDSSIHNYRRENLKSCYPYYVS